MLFIVRGMLGSAFFANRSAKIRKKKKSTAQNSTYFLLFCFKSQSAPRFRSETKPLPGDPALKKHSAISPIMFNDSTLFACRGVPQNSK